MTARVHKRNFFLKLLCCYSLTLMSSEIAAKARVNHWGVGVTNVGPNFGSPQISAAWQMSRASAVEMMVGIDTVQNSNSLSLGGRFNRHLFVEESLDYGAYLGGGLLTSKTGDNQSASSGYYFEAGAMANVFLPGLPNLGIQLGSGLRLESPGSTRIRTVFFSGFHYYF